jgi:hypothetical protein
MPRLILGLSASLLLSACQPAHQMTTTPERDDVDDIPVVVDPHRPVLLSPKDETTGLPPGHYVQDLGDGKWRTIIVEPRRPEQPPLPAAAPQG